MARRPRIALQATARLCAGSTFRSAHGALLFGLWVPLSGSCSGNHSPKVNDEPNPGCCDPGRLKDRIYYPEGCRDDRDCPPGTFCNGAGKTEVVVGFGSLTNGGTSASDVANCAAGVGTGGDGS